MDELRPTVVERYVEWCRRNPVAVDAVLAVLVALIGVALARSAYSPRAQWDQSTGPAPGPVVLFMLVVSTLVALCAWLAGALRRARRRSVEQLRERARLLEEGRWQEVRLELLAERTRISREVHDVVAHSLSGVIAQADGGQYAATRDPQRAVDVLAGIAATGREALNEVRRLLDMLRDTAPVDDTADGGGPQPGADDVPALVEHVRAGGSRSRSARPARPSR